MNCDERNYCNYEDDGLIGKLEDLYVRRPLRKAIGIIEPNGHVRQILKAVIRLRKALRHEAGKADKMLDMQQAGLKT